MFKVFFFDFWVIVTRVFCLREIGFLLCRFPPVEAENITIGLTRQTKLHRAAFLPRETF